MESTHSFVSTCMKSTFLTICIFLLATMAYCQHYYNDIVVTGENMKKRAAYGKQQVRSVRFSSFDSNNQPIEGFKCDQVVKSNATEIITTTTDPLAGTTENTSSFNAAGQLIKSVDTTDASKTVVTYTWDAATNRITQVLSLAISAGGYTSKEQHLWFYNNAGKPVSMLKVKNNTDTTKITYVADEKGNPGEEKSFRQGQSQPSYYYYYDDNNHLTDIVRYNARAKRLLPDYVFEYEAQGRVATMMVVAEGTGDYQKWYYTYDEKGLKAKDECFSKTKVLIGKVVYQYQF
jgi:YD repeat-containing protein